MSGTTGESRRLEAIQIRLTGEMAEVEFVDNVEIDVTSEDLHINYQSLADIKFAYCTEFLNHESIENFNIFIFINFNFIN